MEHVCRQRPPHASMWPVFWRYCVGKTWCQGDFLIVSKDEHSQANRFDIYMSRAMNTRRTRTFRVPNRPTFFDNKHEYYTLSPCMENSATWGLEPAEFHTTQQTCNWNHACTPVGVWHRPLLYDIDEWHRPIFFDGKHKLLTLPPTWKKICYLRFWRPVWELHTTQLSCNWSHACVPVDV